MGLGSDSEPVPISLLGQPTHLADSMQFALEYFLRIEPNLPGVYCINTPFRGEDSDAMHLNQFYHTDCEVLGDFSNGITIAKKYITSIISFLIRDHAENVTAAAGTTSHLNALLELYRSHNNTFRRVPLDENLNLDFICNNETCWKYVIPEAHAKGRVITRAGESKLTSHFGGAVWLTEMDHLSVPFYQAYTDNSTRIKARCADFLLGNGEVLGLGERHQRPEDVRAALEQHEVDAKAYEWYMGMREQKQMLTTGWGMGVERFLAWVFKRDHMRDLTVVPRRKGVVFAPQEA